MIKNAKGQVVKGPLSLPVSSRIAKWKSQDLKSKNSQALIINLPHDAVITVLGIYPKDLMSYSTVMLIDVLFTTARKWKLYKYPKLRNS